MAGVQNGVIDEFREEFYRQFYRMEDRFCALFMEVQYRDKMRLKYPRHLLTPTTLGDYIAVLEMEECKYVVNRFLECDYDYKERYCDKNGMTDYYVLTSASEGWVWVIEASCVYATFSLKRWKLSEIKKYEKEDMIPLQLFVIKYGIDLSYAWEW